MVTRNWDFFPLNLRILFISGLASPLSVKNITNVLFDCHFLSTLLTEYFSPYVQVFDYHLVWLPILPSVESEFSLEKFF